MCTKTPYLLAHHACPTHATAPTLLCCCATAVAAAVDNTYDQFVWQSGTARGTPPHRLLLQNDGRLVLYDANSYAIWSVS